MFTDMVGYTALTQSNETKTMELLERQNGLLRPMFARFNGREVKTIGDSFLVEFDSALDALRCAVDIQSYLHDYNGSSVDEWKISLRIGIHLGDVIHRNGDVFGDAVNISSRIEPVAEPGGVCISRQVYDQVHNKFELPIVSLGEKVLKNVVSPTEVFSVRMPWEAKTERVATATRRVAVLPFASMSPDPNDEYLADGLTEELISTVSRIEGAEVISRTSVMQYKKAAKPIKEISRELDAGTVLEGSVRKAGNRLRVTVQMIDAPRDRHVWAESYDRNLDDVFAIQSDIAERVAAALRARVAPSGSRPVEDMEAYTAYLRGLQAYHEGTPESGTRAISLFESAIARNPNFAKAYAGLAFAWRSHSMFVDHHTSVERAEDAARRALELAPDLAEAHAAMASIHMSADRFDEARKEMEKAIQINPNYDEGYRLLGEDYCAFGRFDEGIANFRKASALNPLSSDLLGPLGHSLRVAGRVGEALEVFNSMGEAHPDYFLGKAICYMQLGDPARAGELLHKGLQANPNDPFMKYGMALLYAVQGKKAEAERQLKELASFPSESVRLNAEFQVRAILGDFDDAFKALDRLADLHAWIFLAKSEPMMGGIQKEPRFADFCRKVGLPP
jgi:adenylate cyclase